MVDSPRPYFTQQPQGIWYSEGKSFGTAAVILPFSLFFLAFAIVLLFEMVTWPWHMGTLFGLLTITAFVVFGLVTGLLSLAAVQPQHLEFNRINRRLHGRARGRFWLLYPVDIPFDQLQRPQICRTGRESDGDIFEIRLGRDGAFALNLASFDSHDEANLWLSRIADLIASDPVSRPNA